VKESVCVIFANTGGKASTESLEGDGASWNFFFLTRFYKFISAFSSIDTQPINFMSFKHAVNPKV
jgi:hypothetical protein